MSNQYQPYHINQGPVQQWHQQQFQSNQQYSQQTGHQSQQQSVPASIQGLFEAALPILVVLGLIWAAGLFSGNKNNQGNWSGVFTFLTVVVVAGIGLYVWSEIKTIF